MILLRPCILRPSTPPETAESDVLVKISCRQKYYTHMPCDFTADTEQLTFLVMRQDTAGWQCNSGLFSSERKEDFPLITELFARMKYSCNILCVCMLICYMLACTSQEQSFFCRLKSSGKWRRWGYVFLRNDIHVWRIATQKSRRKHVSTPAFLSLKINICLPPSYHPLSLRLLILFHPSYLSVPFFL